MTSKIKVDNIANQSDSNIVNKCSTTITVGTGSDTTNVPGAAVVTGNITGAEITSSSNVVKSNAYQASDGGNIVSQSGSTITIGASGDTVSLASGASQTGFGRSGSVNWDTTAKTADFTAVSGNGYFVNTTSGTVTVTLPASPSAGDIVAVADYAGTSETNAITIARNGSNFEGGTANGQITTNRQAVTLVYVDGTQGWLPTNENDSSFQQPLFTVATGGTITTSGNFKIHTFTGPGTFCVSQVGNCVPGGGPGNVDYLVLAGGGGGGSMIGGAGGGGAGGHRTTFPSPGCNAGSFPITASPFPITVGGGGTFPTPGSNSVFSTITSAGGGSGGGSCGPAGQNGGSGGGGAGTSYCAAGSGNTPPVTPPQGNNGGTGTYSQPNTGCTSTQTGGGGGGANAAGSNAPGPAPGPKTAGAGGNGVDNSITGSPLTRGGGGGGGASDAPGGANQGNRAGGGSGGGGNGTDSRTNGTSGEANRGGGGGGNGYPNPVTAPKRSGGSGIVIIRYKFQ